MFLQEFIDSVEHRNFEPESDKDLQQCGRKFLVTQAPKFVNWEQIYPYVSDDFDSINFRAPDVLSDYANFLETDPKIIENMVCCEENDRNSRNVFKEYLNTIQCPQGMETFAVFAHGQKNKNLEHFYPELSEQINKFEPQEELDLNTIGEYFRNLVVSTNTEPVMIIESKEPEETIKSEEQPIVVPEQQQWTHELEEQSWRNSILKAFKTEHDLPQHFSALNTMKQIILGLIVDDEAYNLGEKAGICGKFQTNIDVKKLNISDKELQEDILTVIDYLPNEVIERCAKTHVAQQFYKKAENSRELVKMLLYEQIRGEKKENLGEMIKFLF